MAAPSSSSSSHSPSGASRASYSLIVCVACRVAMDHFGTPNLMMMRTLTMIVPILGASLPLTTVIGTNVLSGIATNVVHARVAVQYQRRQQATASDSEFEDYRAEQIEQTVNPGPEVDRTQRVTFVEANEDTLSDGADTDYTVYVNPPPFFQPLRHIDDPFEGTGPVSSFFILRPVQTARWHMTGTSLSYPEPCKTHRNSEVSEGSWRRALIVEQITKDDETKSPLLGRASSSSEARLHHLCGFPRPLSWHRLLAILRLPQDPDSKQTLGD